MAGTLFGLGLSQQLDLNGVPMSGALLYIYLANSSTPVTAYKNVALTPGQEHLWPIQADANGRIPAFWLADGSYRARLTDAGGIPQFDVVEVLAIGPSTGTGSGTTTDPNATLLTGDIKWRPTQEEQPGWVRLYGGTLGSATSGSNYSAAANQNLFLHIWNNVNNVANTICPVVGGRGANAAADWAANKKITLLDMRGRSPFGFENMGGSSNSMFSSVPFSLGDGVTPGSAGGEPRHTLLGGEITSHQHDVFVDDPTHRHTVGDQTYTNAINQGIVSGVGTSGIRQSFTTFSATGIRIKSTNAAQGVGIDDKTSSYGSNGAHNNMPPFIPGTWYWRL